MSREFRNGLNWGTSYFWEDGDIPGGDPIANYGRLIDLEKRYALGDKAAGQTIITALYGPQHVREIPRIPGGFIYPLPGPSSSDDGLWHMIVNGSRWEAYWGEAQDVVAELAADPATQNAAGRFMAFHGDVGKTGLWIAHTAPHLNFGEAFQHALQAFWDSPEIRLVKAAMQFIFPQTAPFMSMYDKWARKQLGENISWDDIIRAGGKKNAKIPGFDEGLSLSFVDEAVQSVKDYVKDILDSVTEWIKGVFERIAQTIADLVETVTDTLTNLFSKLVDTIDEAITRAIGFLENMISEIATSINSFIEETVSAIQDTFAQALEYVQGLISDVQDFINELTGILSQEIQEIFDGVQDVIATIEASISTLVDSLVTGTESALSTVREAVESVPASVRESVESVIESIKELPDKYGEALLNLTINPFILQVFGGEDSTPDTDAARIEGALKAIGIDADNSQSMARMMIESAPQATIPRKIFLGLVVIGLLFQGISGPMAIAHERAKQAFNINMPSKLMSEADQLVAALRGLKPGDTVLRELRATGYSEEDARVMFDLRRQLMPPGELLVWWLRGIITEGELDEVLAISGVSQDDAARLKAAAFFIPPAQDLITMAVRDVFDPATAEKFGQFEDFPEAFKDWAAKQGISEEWARNYWAAHWHLPSPNQGFEMFQRNIITDDELRMLLKSLDVMPFWRDKLINLSFNTLTRVDVRRMHQVGVMDREGMLRAYRDMGYSPEHAEQLTEFTEKLNAPKVAEDETHLEQISRNSILAFYESGVIPRERAHVLLVGLGASEEAAELYLELSDMKAELEERRLELETILAQEAAGIISFDQAVGRIGELGFSTLEQQKAVAKMAQRHAKSVKLPSRTELDAMHAREIITDELYMDTLERIGYSQDWSARFLSLARFKERPDES